MEILKTKTSIIMIILVGGLGITSTLFGVSFINNNNQTENYQEMVLQYNNLSSAYLNLSSKYSIITGDYCELNVTYWDLNASYSDLEANYNNLQAAYNTLNTKYQAVLKWIKQMIPPSQYLVFADAVRRHYMDLYLDFTNTKSVYKGATEFCRDIVLHDSGQKNMFTDVSNAFTDAALKFGSNTTKLANFVMNESFAKDSPYWGITYWGGKNLVGDEITDINNTHSETCDLINYEYDSNITIGQDDPEWDYFKFAVETAFRTLGDCDDQAIFDAVYLESCGFETALAFVHDSNHPTYGSFYHASLFVHIEDTTEYYSRYSTSLYSLGGVDPYPGYTWCWLDPTWDIPFGDVIPWTVGYSPGWDVLTIAICDIDGAIA